MPRAKKTAEPQSKAGPPQAGKTENFTEVVRSTAEELLSQLQIEATVSVSEVEGIYNINLETPESGLLIGYHGETLSSFQLILGLMIYKRTGSWVKVVVEVGDYRAKRAEQLTAMAESYANQVVSTGQAITLPPLPPAERRVIHMALQNRGDVETESVGEGNQRRVVVKPKV
ncbi:KH domain-containing protein [Patescibacteria group bacterium]|nr:KH domain-containing protein [Patescibacteria group bacterium]